MSFAKSAIPFQVNVLPMIMKAFKQRDLKVGFHSGTVTNLKNCSNHKLLDVVAIIWLNMNVLPIFCSRRTHAPESQPVFEFFVKIIPHSSKAWYTASAYALLNMLKSVSD